VSYKLNIKMNIEVVQQRYPLPTEHFHGFLRKEVTPGLDVAQLEIQLLVDDERKVLKTPVTGNISHVLKYKGREGAVSSFTDRDNQDLILVQLQGAKSSVSWRVTTGLRWCNLFMSEALQIANLDGSGIRRIGMPNPLFIQGIESSESEEILYRYQAFITFAALQWSEDDQLFVRDI
jgi:hypothetical protein